MAEYVFDLDKMRATCDKALEVLNKAMQSKDSDKIAFALEDVKTEITAYNKAREVAEFIEMRETDAPMLIAVKTRKYDSISLKPVKDERFTLDKKTGKEVSHKVLTRYEIAETESFFDLKDFEDFCKRPDSNGNIVKIASDTSWRYRVEKFCKLVGYKTFRELEKPASAIKTFEQKFSMTKEAKAIADSKDETAIKRSPNPISNTQLLKYLDEIVKAMLDDKYKATSKDVAFVVTVMNRYNAQNDNITLPSASYMRQLISAVLYHIVSKKEYEVFYQTEKENKNGEVITTSAEKENEVA